MYVYMYVYKYVKEKGTIICHFHGPIIRRKTDKFINACTRARRPRLEKIKFPAEDPMLISIMHYLSDTFIMANENILS